MRARRRRRSIFATFTALLLSLLMASTALAKPPPSPPGQDREGAEEQPEPSERPERKDAEPETAPAADFDHHAADAERQGSARVIVGLRTSFTPEAGLSEGEARAQRERISQSRAALVASLRGTQHRVVHEYETVPYVALELSAPAVRALQRSERVASLQEDGLSEPGLAESSVLVESVEAANVGRTGTGKVVAVLDTGVDKTHPFLSTKVVEEACYSSGSNCPNGTTSQTGSGSGVNCTFSTECAHGTHVAGIVAGSSVGNTRRGIAAGSRLMAVQVFHKETVCKVGEANPCARAYDSDLMKGLERVYNLRTTHSFAAVNMSLGGGKYTANCDTSSLKSTIDNLRYAGIATVIASGNDGYNDAVAHPACISTAITVGATTKADAVWSSSNSSSLVELLAPGVSISSSVPGGGYESWSGTSMAAPHVAGAWAIMKQTSSGASVASVLQRLQDTGRLVTDPDNNVAKPRIRVLSASVRLADTGFRHYLSWGAKGAGVVSQGIGLAKREGATGSGNITISGIPAGATVTGAYLYWMTIGGPDPTALFKGSTVTGRLVGASRDTCESIDRSQPNRTYFASVGSLVTGNGTYSVSGVGVAPGDGQGASLVVTYNDPNNTSMGRFKLYHGAKTALPNETVSHTFTDLYVPSAPTSVRLNMAMGDGETAFSEDPITFRGTAITGANFYFGADGPMWDDDTIGVSASLLPAGTTSATVSLKSTGDCLAWPYAVLGYKLAT